MQLGLLTFCLRGPKGSPQIFLGSSLVPGVQILERGMKCCFFLFTFLCIIPTIWRLEQASQIRVTVIQFTIHLQSAVCKCHTLPLGQGSVVTIKQHSVDMSPNIILSTILDWHINQLYIIFATSAKTRLICLWWQKNTCDYTLQIDLQKTKLV